MNVSEQFEKFVPKLDWPNVVVTSFVAVMVCAVCTSCSNEQGLKATNSLAVLPSVEDISPEVQPDGWLSVDKINKAPGSKLNCQQVLNWLSFVKQVRPTCKIFQSESGCVASTFQKEKYSTINFWNPGAPGEWQIVSCKYVGVSWKTIFSWLADVLKMGICNGKWSEIFPEIPQIVWRMDGTSIVLPKGWIPFGATYGTNPGPFDTFLDTTSGIHCILEFQKEGSNEASRFKKQFQLDKGLNNFWRSRTPGTAFANTFRMNGKTLVIRTVKPTKVDFVAFKSFCESIQDKVLNSEASGSK